MNALDSTPSTELPLITSYPTGFDSERAGTADLSGE